MERDAEKLISEAKEQLVYYLTRMPGGNNGEIESIVDLIIEAAVLKAVDRINHADRRN